MSARLQVLHASGEVALDGTLCVVGAGRGFDFSALDGCDVSVVQPFFPDHAALLAQGLEARVTWPETADVVVVVLPRAKALALTWIAQAAQVAQRLLVIDGQKTDGVESILKAVKRLTRIDGTVSKAHGKLAWLAPTAVLAALAPPPPADVDGFRVAAGVFSADGVDPASRALAAALPDKLVARVADLGAGWGYLSAQILQRDGVVALDVVEADHIALTCARANVRDPRAAFHWADATLWKPSAPLDTVVMNPPFHAGRAAEPELGQAFIRNAARCLGPRGRLWLVANRHLPYEQVLKESFLHGTVTDAPGGAFKIIEATHPRRAGSGR